MPTISGKWKFKDELNSFTMTRDWTRTTNVGTLSYTCGDIVGSRNSSSSDISIRSGGWSSTGGTLPMDLILKGNKSNEGIKETEVFSQMTAGDDNTGIWLDDQYKIIDFGDTEQTVSQDFYTWFVQNATSQSTLKAVSSDNLAAFKEMCDETYAAVGNIPTVSTELVNLGTLSTSGTLTADQATQIGTTTVGVTARASVNNVTRFYERVNISGTTAMLISADDDALHVLTVNLSTRAYTLSDVPLGSGGSGGSGKLYLHSLVLDTSASSSVLPYTSVKVDILSERSTAYTKQAMADDFAQNKFLTTVFHYTPPEQVGEGKVEGFLGFITSGIDGSHTIALYDMYLSIMGTQGSIPFDITSDTVVAISVGGGSGGGIEDNAVIENSPQELPSATADSADFVQYPAGTLNFKLKNFQGNPSGYKALALKDDVPNIPTPTSSDNGKVLGVANGAYALQEASGGGAKLYRHEVATDQDGAYTEHMYVFSPTETEYSSFADAMKDYKAVSYKGVIQLREGSGVSISYKEAVVLGVNTATSEFILYDIKENAIISMTGAEIDANVSWMGDGVWDIDKP